MLFSGVQVPLIPIWPLFNFQMSYIPFIGMQFMIVFGNLSSVIPQCQSKWMQKTCGPQEPGVKQTKLKISLISTSFIFYIFFYFTILNSAFIVLWTCDMVYRSSSVTITFLLPYMYMEVIHVIFHVTNLPFVTEEFKQVQEF